MGAIVSMARVSWLGGVADGEGEVMSWIIGDGILKTGIMISLYFMYLSWASDDGCNSVRE